MRSGARHPHRTLGYALAALAAVCWASGGLAAKWLFSPLDAATARWPLPPLGIVIAPEDLAATRALLAFAMLLSWSIAFRRDALRVRTRDVPFFVVFGVVGLALVHFTYFKTISLTNVATAILLEYLAPVIVLIVSTAVLRERLDWNLPVAVVLSIAGCALVVGVAEPGGVIVSPEGIAWGLASAVFFAAYTIMGRWAATRYAPRTLLTYGLGAASVFWLVALGGPGRMLSTLADPRALRAVCLVAFLSTVVPFGAFLEALKHIRATEASVTSTLEPVIAAVAAWALMHEPLSMGQIVGGVCVIAGMLLAQLHVRSEPAVPPAG